MERGLLMVYTGDAKSEANPALGQVFRALGRGLKVCVIQFVKGSCPWEELNVAGRFGDLLDIHVPGRGFGWKSEDSEKAIEIAREAWELAKEAVKSRKYDLVLLDNITWLIERKMVDEAEVIAFLRDRPENVHLIATGQDASQSLIEAADLVTEVREIKHRSSSEVSARKGGEF